MSKQRIVVIGVGSIGERHVRCFLATNRADVAIVEINPQLAQTVSQRYSVPVFNSISQSLEFHPNAAVVATPAPLHVPQTIDLVEAGLHVLIEKPLSTSFARIAELRSLVARRKSIIGMAYVYRSFPVLASLRRALQSGRFGTPREIVYTGGQHFPTYRPAYREIYYRDRQQGGGAIQDALTHVVNYAEWVAGPVCRVTADAEHLVLPGVDVEDTVHVLARHGDVLASYSLNQHQAPNESALTVVCDMGTLRCEFHQNRWLAMTSPGSTWTEENFGAVERDSAFIAQAHSFLDCVKGAAKPLCSLAEGIQTLRVNLAILNSVANGRWETIENQQGETE